MNSIQTSPLRVEEIWKPIPGYENNYECSNLGRIRSIDRIVKDNGFNRTRLFKGVLRRPEINKSNGYYLLPLTKNGVRKMYSVHRLITRTFLGESTLTVDHLNGIRTDNRIENLEYVSFRENNLRMWERKGTSSNVRGVTWDKSNKMWKASIQIDKTTKNLGLFKDKLLAGKAYSEAQKKYLHAE